MLSVKDYYESMKHAKEAVTQRMKISLCYKLLLIFIRSSEPPHFSLMGKKLSEHRCIWVVSAVLSELDRAQMKEARLIYIQDRCYILLSQQKHFPSS